MTEVQSRLVSCFSAVFPELSPEEIQRASPASVGSWDSLASVTLLSVLEEEFQIQFALEDIEHLVSFELVLDYLRQQNHIA